MDFCGPVIPEDIVFRKSPSLHPFFLNKFLETTHYSKSIVVLMKSIQNVVKEISPYDERTNIKIKIRFSSCIAVICVCSIRHSLISSMKLLEWI